MTRAIEFLHNSVKPIVHRNLRAKNVLFIATPADPMFPDIRIAGFEFAIQGDSPDFDAGLTQKARDIGLESFYEPPEHPHYYTASDGKYGLVHVSNLTCD